VPPITAAAMLSKKLEKAAEHRQQTATGSAAQYAPPFSGLAAIAALRPTACSAGARRHSGIWSA
jgi:hypothetical protein